MTIFNHIEITKAELLDALEQASPSGGPDTAHTSAELLELTGFGEKRLRKALHALQKEGRLDVHPVWRVSLDGRRIAVTGYTVKPGKSKTVQTLSRADAEEMAARRLNRSRRK